MQSYLLAYLMQYLQYNKIFLFSKQFSINLRLRQKIHCTSNNLLSKCYKIKSKN